MTAPFIHLRNHSAYSLLKGAIKIPELLKLAQKNNMPAVAVTDDNNLFGALEFSLSALKLGIQPIFGTLLAVRFDEDPKEVHPALLLAQNEAGYKNLLYLISTSYLDLQDTHEPSVSFALLAEYSSGLILLTGGANSILHSLIDKGLIPKAETLIKQLQTIFKDRLYIELMRHNCSSENLAEPHLIGWADTYNIPLVATNDCYFKTEKDFIAHDALCCIEAGHYVEQQDRPRLNPDYYFKSSEEMAALFADIPEAILNTSQIAKRCSFILKAIDPILPPFTTSDGSSEIDFLQKLSEDGLKERLKNYLPEKEYSPYFARLAYELDVIGKMGFPGYFLIVSDFIKWAKENRIPVGPGRGSGAGSVVAWSLMITDLDPIRWGLLFERFLNPERVSMPDFDIDFCQERRDEVIQYVQKRYGYDHVAQIITFGKLQARAVLRDVGRVLQMPYMQVDRICKMIPNNPAMPVTLQEAIDGEIQLQAMINEDPSVKELSTIALKLEGLYRHASTHAAGVVIGDRPLHELVPMYRDPKSSMPVTQFNMKYVEQAGLVKFDFLGLKTLTTIQKTIELIAQGGGAKIDISTIPLDDKKTFELLSRGDTIGVFQVESAGMRDILKKMGVEKFEEIIALVSLYRPGPMDNIPKYIAVKKGLEKPDYLHPSLKPILEETFGIMIYQEQVMQIAQTLSGYTLGGADLLRRAMGKKIQEEMDVQREIFTEGAKQNNIPTEQSGMIFDQVAKFAGYGFNKSHAAAYALIAYQTAYLKANYPVEFLAASMTLDLGNTDKLIIFHQELGLQKIPLYPPDVNHSEAVFSAEIQEGEKGIRYALGAIKGVGEAAMHALVLERKSGGPFQSMLDFATRLDGQVMNKRQLEHLIYAGAFDTIEPDRERLIHSVEFLTRISQAAIEENQTGQQNLFGNNNVKNDFTPELPKVIASWDQFTKLRHEFSAIGFYLSAHPLDSYTKSLNKLKITSITKLREKGLQTKSRLAGIVTAFQERNTRKGSKMGFMQLSSQDSLFEVVFFSEMLAIARPYMQIGESLIIDVDCQIREGEVRLLATRIQSLNEVLLSEVRILEINLQDEIQFKALSSILNTAPKGASELTFNLKMDAKKTAQFKWNAPLAITDAIMTKLKQIDRLELKECG